MFRAIYCYFYNQTDYLDWFETYFQQMVTEFSLDLLWDMQSILLIFILHAIKACSRKQIT